MGTAVLDKFQFAQELQARKEKYYRVAYSIPFRGTAAKPPEPKRRETMSLTEMESYRELILENIEYDFLKQRFGTYRED